MITLAKAVLKFQKIELKNYRPFVDEFIDFSQENKRPITIVEGKNSAGKTSLVHAIHWCLYGDEKDIAESSKGKPRCNKKTMRELKIDEEFNTEVKITLADEDGPKYIISRTIKAKRFSDDNSEKFDTDAGGKVPKGITFSTTRNFSEKRKDGSWKSTDLDNIFTSRVEKLIPNSIAEFIIFNGEELDNFFKYDSVEKIKTGIKKVSGLPVLDSAIAHCEAMTKTYKKKSAKDAGADAQILNAEIESLKAQIKKDKIKYDRESKNVQELIEAEKILEIEREKLGGTKALDELKKHLEDEKRHKKEYQDFVARISQDQREYLIDNFSFVYCYDILENAQKILKKSELDGETPPPIHDYYVHGLIEQKECICGNDLSKDTRGLKKLGDLEETLHGTQIAEIANEGKTVLAKLFREKELGKISERLIKFRDDENKYKSAYRESREAVDGLMAKLENTNEKAITKNMQHLAKLRTQKGELEQSLPFQHSQILANDAKVQDMEKRLEKLTGETSTTKKWKRMYQLASMAYDDLLRIKYEILNDIRKDVRKTCEDIFIKIIARGSEIKKVDLTENYEMKVLDHDDDNIIGTLSAGQFLFLSLAYIAAVRTVTDTNFPMIIDSPLGRVDGEQRLFAAKTLPIYLEDVQMSLFVTNVEIDAIVEEDTETGERIGSVRELWNDENRIAKNWLLKINKDKEISTIEEIK